MHALCLCSCFIYFAFDSSELIIFGSLIFIFAYFLERENILNLDIYSI